MGTILIRRLTHALFEQAREMLWIFEAHFKRNFIDRFFGFKYTVFCHVDGLVLYVVLGRYTGFSFDQISKVISRQMQGIREITNGWDAVNLGLIRFKIVVH